jgi:uncharacterized protein (DUF362 family)
MKRREFVRDAVAGGIMFAVPGALSSQETPPPDLAFIRGGEPEALTRKAVEVLGGMNRFISRGDVVMIKPNIAFDLPPKLAGCTNPDVVGTVVAMCLESGAREVRVMDHPVHPAKATYANSGIAAAVEKAGGRLIDPDIKTLKSMSIDGQSLKTALVFPALLEVDKIINVPILKTHSLTRLTMGIKNWMGAVGGNREIYHDDINEIIVDLAAFFKPALTILDAYRTMARNGPDGGRLADIRLTKTIIAGRDPVAVDAMGATMFNNSPNDLSFLKSAFRRGLGEIDLQKLRVGSWTIKA